MDKICLIMPYFGKWPRWFDIYMETCRHNPMIDWIFFTDCKIPKSHPKNVKFFRFSLEKFNELATKNWA